MQIRPRRLRRNRIIREMVAETRLHKDMFIYPYFVRKGNGIKSGISSMPGVYHFSPDALSTDVEALLKCGINKILLFGVGDPKSTEADSSHDPSSSVPTAIRRLKADFGKDLYVITDICVCSYTTHGHCGILANDQVLNEPTLDVLAEMAVIHAEAGADMVAPSDMMDGRVAAIREALDSSGFDQTAIMSYAVKYASAYYGPFREAADSAPQKGDRKGYQMDMRNSREAIKEAILDEQEGADILMVKPALVYLDIIRELKENSYLPVACYNVSGEYSMIKNAANAGLVEEQSIVMENFNAMARAGADIIITYYAKEMMEKGWL